MDRSGANAPTGPFVVQAGTGDGTEGTLGCESRPHPHPAPMNCREFRRKHDAYIDDTLSGVELERMASHRRLCEPCAHLDTRVRRALLVARNLPTIDVSPAFAERLQARLAVERASLANSSPALWRWGQLSA